MTLLYIDGVRYSIPFVLTGCHPEPPPSFSVCFGNWSKNFLDRVPKEYKRAESVRELVHSANYVSVVTDLEAQRWALNESCWWWQVGDDLPKRLRAELRVFWLSIRDGFEKGTEQ